MNYCQITFAKPAWDNDEAIDFHIVSFWQHLDLFMCTPNNLREMHYEAATLKV